MIIIDSYKYKRYLLDRYPAKVAYSLMQLKTGITYVVRVRRSSDNAEQDFRATQITDGTLTTFTGVGDGFVTTWYDQGSGIYHATQPIQANQPQIVASGVLITENNKPGIKFGALTSTGLDSPPFANNNGAVSLYLVSKPLSATQVIYANIVDLSHFDGGGLVVQQNGDQNNNFYFAVRYTGGYYTTDAVSALTFNVNNLMSYYSTAGSNNVHFRNGTQVASQSTVGFSGTSGDINIRIGNWRGNNYQVGGNDRQYNGLISEIIYYQSDNRASGTAIRSNINTRYTIY